MPEWRNQEPACSRSGVNSRLYNRFEMRWWIAAASSFFLITFASLKAQTSMPIGILRGDVIAWQGSPAAGELTVRSAQNTVYGCSYDYRTYVERDHWRISISSLAAGDPVELMADRRAGSSNCYLRTVQ